MKLTKLQRDALRLARWWTDKSPFAKPPFSNERMDELDKEQRDILHGCNVWDAEVYASAILSEVM